MPEVAELLPHLLIREHVGGRAFNRDGGGNLKVRDVERRTHGERIRNEAGRALDSGVASRSTFEFEELESLGVVITLEGARGFPLKLESLESQSRHKQDPRPRWLLLSVLPESEDMPERAQVWVADEFRAPFMERFERFISEDTRFDKPKNLALVANIARIRQSVLEDLWQSAGHPPRVGRHWWEVWLQPSENAVGLAARYSEAMQLRILEKSLRFDNRHVVWLQATWEELFALPLSAVPVTELRRPVFVDTIEDLDNDEQDEYAYDLADRIVSADADAPAVCLLDTGVRRTHSVLAQSLSVDDMHTIVGEPRGDLNGHGTKMAGLALIGPIDSALVGSGPVRLLHRLESVKFLPDGSANGRDPSAYGVVTAEAVALPEIESSRARVFSMPITATGLDDRPGEPSLWSAAVDALAAGTGIGQSNAGIELLGPPDDEAKRLIVLSAGNVDIPYDDDHITKSELEPIQDPAQAWNAITVAASTHLVDLPTDPTYMGWKVVADSGELSPHSRTGTIAGSDKWPIKPDICMEGGNVLSDGAGGFHGSHPLLSLRTTGSQSDTKIDSANATSAATSQASRLAARAMALYPSYWPETIRGLLVHSAEWTPAMRQAIDAEPAKKKRRQLLRRYGWGVPSERAVLGSSQNAVTMVVQDVFVPFTGTDYKMREFRLHQLPWPRAKLEELGEVDVELRVTLSYFVEPSGSRRGWRQRYSYASHALRFDLNAPNESPIDFVRRVNQQASIEEGGSSGSASTTDKWTVGYDQRIKGSLHQDIWSGHGAELATTGTISVHPVGGWWKNNKRKDRQDLPVRYSLVVSLRTPAQEIDLYTPIATEIGMPAEGVAIEI
ncbi:MAG: S8 family peptidase [Acidimicrobiales bacterium]|nr:S8 family peptidase [Acidimicrobiales bacterium]MYI29562.1 S8 family peptidase [Acidimicrobiales bacterium]